MDFCFDRIACMNIRRSLRKEWLLSNGLGDYASSSLIGCNTRKYHGLLVANLPQGRHVLLSALEESLHGGGKEFSFSTRRHPGVYHPRGHENLLEVVVNPWPRFTYTLGRLHITRELCMPHGTTLLLVRYTLRSVVPTPPPLPPLTLRIRPLLAYRHFHNLTRKNGQLRTGVTHHAAGFVTTPYDSLPPLYVTVSKPCSVDATPDWYHNVQYFIEQERGFPFEEDLFLPATLDMPIALGESVYVSFGTSPAPGDIPAVWAEDERRGSTLMSAAEDLFGHFYRQAEQFMIQVPAAQAPQGAVAGKKKGKAPAATEPEGDMRVLAGYHWFDAWGRDTFIALPGLTFCAGRLTRGMRILESVGSVIKNGLVPNCFDVGGPGVHQYNSVDASLWYVWAVQKLLHHLPDHLDWVREHAWSHIKAIVDAYLGGAGPHIYVDGDGLLHAGTPNTQLTWMDATANGKPVTPRHGCAVELNALWYNALAFADFLGTRFGEPGYVRTAELRRIRTAFRQRFWVEQDGGYLGDVWHDGALDKSIRPNQIFAVSLPYPVLEDHYQPFVVECVRDNLLTPYGLRTLSPGSRDYRPCYEGGPAERDSAYHQGTVWPWLLGHYTEALLRTAWDIDGAVSALLHTLEPLFSIHLLDAGVGTVSEIFDGSTPHTPNGCISQAWSVAECVRVLRLTQMAAPEVYGRWEERLLQAMRNGLGTGMGVIRPSAVAQATGGRG